MTATVALATNRGVIEPRVKWIDLAEAKSIFTLPDPWPALAIGGFHSDLVNRAYAHLAYTDQFGGRENAEVVLAALGEGFVKPFSRFRFEPTNGDTNHALKMKALDAICELSVFYGDRISAVVWESLAHLTCRANPEVEQSIIREAAAGTLPHHYALVDSSLHATGLVYTFLMHVNSVMFRHTGRILVHNCDCSCSLVNLEEIGGSIDYALPREKIQAASQSVFTHLLAETFKLMECFLPFAYSITPESREIKALL
jgi:hypothetical protein